MNMSSKSALPDNPNKFLTFNREQLREIVLAGGCFWGVDAYIARLYGVAETECAYANGHLENPSYEQVCEGNTGHAEVVKVTYDPARIGLKALLEQFFSIIDPTQRGRQAGDYGDQYRNGIYYMNPADLPVIEQVRNEVALQYTKPLATEILPLTSYYAAEEYHQNYLDKNPNGYCHVSFAALPTEQLPLA